MFCITCYKINCPTPHFYVDPKGGKIPLVGALTSKDIIGSLPSDLAVKFASVGQYRMMEAQQDKFSKEEIKIIREWYEQMQEQIAQNNSGVTVVEEKSKIIDYLVVQCESNHKNYIPLIKKEKDKEDPKTKQQ